MRLKLITAVLCVALSGAALAGTASAKTVKGTVAHINRKAHSFVIAGRHGHLTAVHARHLPAVGRRVKVKVHRLRNGTFRARHIHVGRRHHRVHVRGVVTYVDRHHHRFVVSFRGGSIVVHRRMRRHRHAMFGAHTLSGTTTTTGSTLPADGTVVTVNGNVNGNGTIQASGVTDDGQATGTVQLEGQVLAIDTTANTLTISADDSEDISGASVTVILSSSFNIANYKVGDMLQIGATLNPDGTYTAVGTSQDGNGNQANSSGDQQGQDGQGDGNSGNSSDSGSSSSSGTSTDQQGSSGSDN